VRARNDPRPNTMVRRKRKIVPTRKETVELSTNPIFWANRALTEGWTATRAPATNMSNKRIGLDMVHLKENLEETTS
jgi:hypothetical protein